MDEPAQCRNAASSQLQIDRSQLYAFHGIGDVVFGTMEFNGICTAHQGIHERIVRCGIVHIHFLRNAPVVVGALHST